MIARLLASLVLAAAFAPLAGAAAGESFGVSPPQIAFTDPPLLPGGAAEGWLRLQNGFDHAAVVTLVPEGEIAPWVTFDVGDRIEMAPRETRAVAVRVQVPDAAATGEYASLLRIRAQGTESPSGSGAALHVEVLPLLRVAVGGDHVVRFAIESARLDDRAPHAPLVAHVDVVNVGNARASPRFELVVRNADGAEALRETLQGVAMEPNAKSRLALAASRGLPKGLYSAELAMEAAQGAARAGPFQFEVRPGGDASAPGGMPGGALSALDVEPWGRVGQPLAIRAAFLNDGEVAIASARLTAEVYRGTERVAVIASEPLRVEPGAQVELVSWYSPVADGAHVVKAHVTYDGVRTAPKDGAFTAGEAGTGSAAAGGAGPGGGNVGGAGEGGAKTPGPAVVLVALVAALVALALSRGREG